MTTSSPPDESGLDPAKASTIDLPALNKWIIGSRKDIRKALLYVIQDLCRKLRETRRLLERCNSQPVEAGEAEPAQPVKRGNPEKLQRRIDSLLAEVNILKRLPVDDMAKLALATDSETLKTPRFLRLDKLNERCLKTLQMDFERLTSVLRRVILRRCVQDCVAAFRREHEDWKRIAAFVMYKTSGRRFKKIKSEKQKRMIPLVAFFPIPNAANSVKSFSFTMERADPESAQHDAESGIEIESANKEVDCERETETRETNRPAASQSAISGQVRIVDVLSSIFTVNADPVNVEQKEQTEAISDDDEPSVETSEKLSPKDKPSQLERKTKVQKLKKKKKSSTAAMLLEALEKKSKVPSVKAKDMNLRKGAAVIRTLHLNELSSDEDFRLDSDADEVDMTAADDDVNKSEDEDAMEEDDFFVKPGSNEPVDKHAPRHTRNIVNQEDEDSETMSPKRKLKSCFVERLAASSSSDNRSSGWKGNRSASGSAGAYGNRPEKRFPEARNGHSVWPGMNADRPRNFEGQKWNSSTVSNNQNQQRFDQRNAPRNFGPSHHTQKSVSFGNKRDALARGFAAPRIAPTHFNSAGSVRNPAQTNSITEDQMHASWQAARTRKQTEKQAIQSALTGSSQNKRIVFGDDD